MSKFFRNLNRLDNNIYPKDYYLFQSQISQLLETHFEIFSIDAGSLSLDKHERGRRGYVAIDISELYENSLKYADFHTDLNFVWVDSSDIQKHQVKLAGESWFVQLKQMVQDYDPASTVNLCLSVNKSLSEK